jgi:hypothetical protein
MHRVSAVPGKQGVPRRLAVDEAAAALVGDGPVTDGHSAEHGDEHAGGTGVMDEVIVRCGHRMCLSDVCVVLIAESPLGLKVRSATWGTGSGSTFREEISDGGAPNETLDRERRVAPWLHGGPAQR